MTRLARHAARLAAAVLILVAAAVGAARAQTQETIARFAQEMTAANGLFAAFLQLDFQIQQASLAIDDAQFGVRDFDGAIREAEALRAGVIPASEQLMPQLRALRFTRMLPMHEEAIAETERFLSELLPDYMAQSLDLLDRDIEAARRRDHEAMDQIDIEWQWSAIRAIEGENVFLKARLVMMSDASPDYHLTNASYLGNLGMIAALTAGLELETDAGAPLRDAAAQIRDTADRVDATVPGHMARFTLAMTQGVANLVPADIDALAQNYRDSAEVERRIAGMLDRFANLFEGASSPSLEAEAEEIAALMEEMQAAVLQRGALADWRIQLVAKAMQ